MANSNDPKAGTCPRVHADPDGSVGRYPLSAEVSLPKQVTASTYGLTGHSSRWRYFWHSSVVNERLSRDRTKATSSSLLEA